MAAVPAVSDTPEERKKKKKRGNLHIHKKNPSVCCVRHICLFYELGIDCVAIHIIIFQLVRSGSIFL